MKTLAVFLASCILAGTVHAVDVTKAEAATKIKTLPVTISAPGYYYLSPNINPVMPAGFTSPAITITSSNVVLDLNGIDLVAIEGIAVHRATDAFIYFITIQNGAITSPASGPTGITPTLITVDDAESVTIDSVNINSGGYEENCILDIGGIDDIIKNCSMRTSAQALILQNCFDNIVNNFFESTVQSMNSPFSGGSVFRNNMFLQAATFSATDLYVGNAFISPASHTGGTDIGGQ